MAAATVYVLRVYKVLSEDPWEAERLEERRYRGWEEAAAAFTELLERLKGEGHTCMDHASAWHMLCARQSGTETVEVDDMEVVPVLEKLFLALEPEPP